MIDYDELKKKTRLMFVKKQKTKNRIRARVVKKNSRKLNRDNLIRFQNCKRFFLQIIQNKKSNNIQTRALKTKNEFRKRRLSLSYAKSNSIKKFRKTNKWAFCIKKSLLNFNSNKNSKSIIISFVIQKIRT